MPLLACRGRGARDLTERGLEGVKLFDTELVDRPRRPGHQGGHELVDHAPGPVVAPSEAAGQLPQPFELDRPQLADGRAHPAQVLGGQKVQVELHPTGERRPGHERPRPDPLEIGQAGPGRAGHPDVEIGVVGEKGPGQPQPVAQRPVRDPQVVAEDGVVLDERVVVVDGQPGDCGRHRPITARAAAYSAATCSLERCT